VKLRGGALPSTLLSLDESVPFGGAERAEFRMVGTGGPVSGTLITPLGAPPGMPALIVGHDLASDHRTERYVDLACEYARRDRYAVAILDGPFHGDRQPPSLAETEAGPERLGLLRAELSKPGRSDAVSADWTALVDVLIELPQVAASKIGFEAVSMSALYGVTFVADEPRVHCAVFHVIGVRTGDQSTVAGPELGGDPFAANVARIGDRPVQLLASADDVLFSRASSELLFDTLTGPERELIVLPGVHFDPPAKPLSGREYAAAFLRRHLRSESQP
jgi:pimeloyl-ACP methyl ester carboxylesterase